MMSERCECGVPVAIGHECAATLRADLQALTKRAETAETECAALREQVRELRAFVEVVADPDDETDIVDLGLRARALLARTAPKGEA